MNNRQALNYDRAFGLTTLFLNWPLNMFILYLAVSNAENDVNSDKSNAIDESNKSSDLNEVDDIFNFDDTSTNVIGERSKPVQLGAKVFVFVQKNNGRV